MKSKLIENKNLKIILPIILFFVLILIVALASKADKNRDDKVLEDGYTISNEVVELPGTNIISNEALNATKCIDDICLSDVKIYSAEGIGRVECMAVNNTSEVKSGNIEITLGEAKILISYKNLEPGESRKLEAGYGGGTIENVNDYSIRFLTPEEEKEIIQ